MAGGFSQLVFNTFSLPTPLVLLLRSVFASKENPSKFSRNVIANLNFRYNFVGICCLLVAILMEILNF